MTATYSQISQYVYSTAETQRQSYDVGDYLRNNSIEGDVVELGVAAGGNFATMLLGCREAGLNKKGWGFDSFQGLKEDFWGTTFTKGAFSTNRKIPSFPNNVKLVEGWFNETLPSFLQEHATNFSFIHLDADTYTSTKEILDFQFPSKGDNFNGIRMVFKPPIGSNIPSIKYFNRGIFNYTFASRIIS